MGILNNNWGLKKPDNDENNLDNSIQNDAVSAATNTEVPIAESSAANNETKTPEVLDNPGIQSPDMGQEAFDEVKLAIHQRLMDELDMARLMSMPAEDTQHQVRLALGQLLDQADVLITQRDKDRLIDDLYNEIMGLGPLETLLADKAVSDILINGAKQVFVERSGKLALSPVTFKDEKHLLQIVDRIVAAVGRRVDESQPLCDARLEDGSRFNCVIPPLALDGTLVSIRKFPADRLQIDDLVRYGTLTGPAAELLRGFVEARLNIIISGSTGSGKTTMLNILSGFIPDDERIVTIEDAAELQLRKSHVARMETRPANIEGKGEITMRDLFRNALRMRPERVVVGECRSGEALDMLQAMNTGHDGSLTTLHANTPRDALRRLETMVMMAGFDLPSRAIREQVASAVHIVLQVCRLSDGSRKVMNITEIVGMEQDIILMQDIFTFEQTGLDENRKVVGEFKATGVRPKFLDQMLAAGIAVDESMFGGFSASQQW